MAVKQTKSKSASGGLYIALAICILSVICIGVYSAVLNIFNVSDPAEPPIENLEQTEGGEKGPSLIIETPEPNPPSPSIKPVETDEAVQETIPEPDVNVNQTPSGPTYTLPIAGGVSKPFSGDVLVWSETMSDYRVHNGVDLIAPIGTQVKAFSDGVVEQIYDDPLMGQTIVISHADETKSIYQNLSPTLPAGIELGSAVKEGQVIAGIGETNLIECAEEPHLHFEVTVKGEHVDPMQYFQ